MIETIAVPLVVKAIDFLFDESRKILEERRSHRQAELESSKNANQAETVPPPTDIASNTTQPVSINTKQNALDTQIDEIRLKGLEKDLAHLLDLCEIYKTNLYQAREKYARFGRDYAPPHLLHEIREAEDGVLDATQRLNKVLSRIYGKEVIVPDLN